LERLEPRIVLDGEFWLSALAVTGAADAPFDKLEVEFSGAVDQATFDAGVVTLTGAAGDIHPTAITDLGNSRFELDFDGQTSKTNYTLVIGPDIEDDTSQAMDQNRDGTAGDAYEAVLRTSNMTILDGDTTHDGKSLILCGGTTTINGAHAFADVQVLCGTTLRHYATTATTEYRLDLNIIDTLIVDAASKIDVSSRGYTYGRTVGNTTQGGAEYNSGGSYGGSGASASSSEPTNQVYGDFRDPNELGSGAGTSKASGGHGGGLVRIVASTVVVDGLIRADGGDCDGAGGSGGGGSGGGIRLDVGTLSGSGSITANGGDAYNNGSSGGGGRIAIYYENLDGFDLETDVTALGGAQSGYVEEHGAPGTVYLQQGDDPGTLRIDNGTVTAAQVTPFGLAVGDRLVLDRLVVSGAGVTALSHHGTTVQATAITVTEGALLSLRPPQFAGMAIEAQDVHVLGGSTLTHAMTNSSTQYSLRMAVTGTLTVDATSKIDVSARGYTFGRTVGNTTQGGAEYNSGGSYGGPARPRVRAIRRTKSMAISEILTSWVPGQVPPRLRVATAADLCELSRRRWWWMVRSEPTAGTATERQAREAAEVEVAFEWTWERFRAAVRSRRRAAEHTTTVVRVAAGVLPSITRISTGLIWKQT